MRFHLIDRIDTWEVERSIRCRKLTSRNEEFWQTTEIGSVMPEPLILEALCQAGASLIFLSTEGRRRAALLSIGSVTFQRAVQPGDVLELEGNIEMGDEVAELSGRVSVAEHTVLEAQGILCSLLEPSDLQDPQETDRMHHLLTRKVGK